MDKFGLIMDAIGLSVDPVAAGAGSPRREPCRSHISPSQFQALAKVAGFGLAAGSAIGHLDPGTPVSCRGVPHPAAVRCCRARRTPLDPVLR